MRAEPVPGEGGFKDLQRVERDAGIDAIVLASYGNKPPNAENGHAWMSELRDMMFSAEPVGSSVEVIVDRFKKKKRETSWVCRHSGVHRNWSGWRRRAMPTGMA